MATKTKPKKKRQYEYTATYFNKQGKRTTKMIKAPSIHIARRIVSELSEKDSLYSVLS